MMVIEKDDNDTMSDDEQHHINNIDITPSFVQ